MTAKKPKDENDKGSSNDKLDDPDILRLPLSENRRLREGFQTRFEVVPALTEELRDEAYRLRHRVYCEDLKWEAPQNDGREIDEYDSHSVSMLLRHVVTGEYVGCARLVLVAKEIADFRLPFERFCEGKLDPALFDFAAQPRDKIAEVSRLAVISKYRRRAGEALRPAPSNDQDLGTESQPRFPYILIGLYLGIVAIAKVTGVETLFLLSEPRLSEHFRRLGVEIKVIGSPVEHRGMRIPSAISVDSVIGKLNRYVRPMYDAILKEVLEAYHTHR